MAEVREIEELGGMEEPRMLKKFTSSQLPEDNSQAILYRPRMVSIGPFHRNIELTPIKTHKERLLTCLISRNTKLTVNGVFEELQKLVPDARKFYENYSFKEDKKIDPGDFVNMLLKDGCFILELFFKWLDEEPDELFTERWGLTTILSDLLLIENQIPFTVIEKLFDMVMEKKAEGKEAEGMVIIREAERKEAEGKEVEKKEAKRRRNAFLNFLVQFLMNDPEPPHPSIESPPKEIRHILDLCHYFLISPEQSQEEKNDDQTTLALWEKKLTEWRPTAQTPTQWSPTADQWGAKRPPRQIPGAVELYEAGVKFKRNSSFKNLFDVKFVGGTLKIPPLQIDSNKKILLANLLALESQKTCRNQTVTSYITLMDSLINTKEDVALLQHKGVIHNKLSSHKEAAVFFNQLGDRLSIDNVNPYFVELFRKVQLRYDSSLKQSWARLKHDYFNSFWSIISVIAGVILLGLTMAQTFFTIYPYYRPRS